MNVTEEQAVARYGLIGYPLGHSLSPFIHEALMKAAKITGRYDLIEIPPDRLAQRFPKLLSELAGFNCTIPYKERIIPWLAGLDEGAATLGAVNTVWQQRGFNTDKEGFLADGPALAGRPVLILGAGGVSRTLALASAEAGASRLAIHARRAEQAEKLAETVRHRYPACPVAVLSDIGQLPGPHWILLNGTPAGMWPQVAGMPVQEAVLDQVAEVYDTIYNPLATRLVLAARNRGIPARNGLGMLFRQAVAAQQIWHSTVRFAEADLQDIQKQLAAAVLRQFPLMLVLTGFMGSGKSTVGPLLAQALGLPFVDLDQQIEQDTGRTISEIFSQDGEAVFRQLESNQLRLNLGRQQSQIIATGGGALMHEVNRQMIREHTALVFFLDCPLPQICRRIGAGEGRPVWQAGQNEAREKLFAKRRPVYQAVADRILQAEEKPEQIVAAIVADLNIGGLTK